MLQIEDLHASYGESWIVQGISLHVADGEIAAVLGRNGVGKTTLIHAISGLNPPRRGRVLLNGEDISRLPAHQIARRGVGLVPQGRRVFPSLSVSEHLRVGERGAGRWTPKSVMELFPRLAERRRHGGGQLSGGEQAMLAAARALVGNPAPSSVDAWPSDKAVQVVRRLHCLHQSCE